MDDALLDVVLGRIDGDANLSEETTDLLLAACQGDQALARTVGGDPPPRPARQESDQSATEPVGAFLASITAEGFRGIGPAKTLTLHPGPGLTVVVGRNGSGKSSFAEALEMLLTGSIARLDRQSKVFKDGWRNLHQPRPARIAATLHIDGFAGTTTVERTWADDADLSTSRCTVQVAGERTSDLDRLGWSSALVTYRPFLAHSELEAMLDSPSGLYEKLAVVLGLDDLTDAHDRLGRHRGALVAETKSAEDARTGLVADLAQVDDERAVQAVALLEAAAPDFDELARIVTGATRPHGGSLDRLRQLANITTPDLAMVGAAGDGLREAADGLEAVAGSEAAKAKGLADLLDQAVWFHEDHGTHADCPVCGRAAALDPAWRAHAVSEIERLRAEAATAEKAHEAARDAVRHATSLIRPVPAAATHGQDIDVDTTPLVEAWAAWTSAPATRDDVPAELRELADHLHAAVALSDAAEAMRTAATAELITRDDRWSPVAKRVASWIDDGRAAAAATPTVKNLKAAETWLKSALDTIRNDRLAPIVSRAQETWRTLRHESNVDLGAIRLAGSKTRRRVDLLATVDGSDSNALGVMSQGEVNALALSVFLPRATLPESPFRFVVIDDPVQAMDPAKVAGLAQVLHETARTHQVVVFTHDDRLPATIRRLSLDARIVQVQRRVGSTVDVSPAADPVEQALRDARAVASTDGAPVEVKARVVPGLCRLALECALTEIAQRRLLQEGRPHHDVEEALADARRVTQKAALALYGDVDAAGRVMGRLNQIHRRHGDTFKALQQGAHGESVGSPHGTVDATEQLVDALRRAR